MPTLSSNYPRRSLIIKGLTPSGDKTKTTITNINDQATDDKLSNLGYKIYALSNNSWAGTFKQDLTDIVVQSKARPLLGYEYSWQKNAEASFADIKAETTANGKYIMPKQLVAIFGVSRKDRSIDLQKQEIDTVRTIIINNTNFVFVNLRLEEEIYNKEQQDFRRFYSIELAAGGAPTTGTISITTNEVIGYDKAIPFTLTIKE